MVSDADVRLARRIRRDTVERGRDVNSVLEQVSPLFDLCCRIGQTSTWESILVRWLYYVCEYGTWLTTHGNFALFSYSDFFFYFCFLLLLFFQRTLYVLVPSFEMVLCTASILIFWASHVFNFCLRMLCSITVCKVCEAGIWWLCAPHKKICWCNHTSRRW